ncbi:Phage antitermination protein Q [Serratia quinivorans]|uniref:Phage antitermination protein Q n=1 Tax=Serratia quinivorans TaxID=137545 RepID=A0A380AHG2_9GAMM|nr:antiterminator Q family protein [Serratia proteamaculans]RYM64729.1 antitermination protein Q [Serratia proteamaculans]SUI81130.1 Phage antitermination protein Q [Serratia quinivorans]
MRDIQEVLSRWGVWARDNSGVDFSHIAAGFKGLLPQQKGKPSCSDDDGLIIDGALLRLQRVRKPEELDLLLRHYVLGQSKSAIARDWKCNEREIRRQLQVAESFIDGVLCVLGVPLDMDAYVKIVRVSKAEAIKQKSRVVGRVQFSAAQRAI